MSRRTPAPYHVPAIGIKPSPTVIGSSKEAIGDVNCNIGNTVKVTLTDLKVHEGMLVKKTDQLYVVAVQGGFPFYNVNKVTIDKAQVVSILKLKS